MVYLPQQGQGNLGQAMSLWNMFSGQQPNATQANAAPPVAPPITPGQPTPTGAQPGGAPGAISTHIQDNTPTGKQNGMGVQAATGMLKSLCGGGGGGGAGAALA